MSKRIIPKGFFSKVRKITTSEKALKDVIPPEFVDKKQKIVKLVKKNS